VELYEGSRLVDRYQGGCLDLDREFLANGKTVTLREVRLRLINYDLKRDDPIFSQRGQMHIGRQLSSQIFGPDGEEKNRWLLNKIVDVHIVSNDEEVAALPWSLLYSGKLFLTTNTWSVALSGLKENCRDTILPPSPKILIIAPTPLDALDTQAIGHLQDLESLLSAGNRLHRRGEHLQSVESWSDFVTKVKDYQPDVLYYYGHGEGTRDSSNLIFAFPDRTEHKVPVADFAHVLRQMGEHAPVVAYVNCCQGDAGGLLGVTGQLSDFIPAVITNCTTAYVEAARKQALSIWKDILIEGKPPHEAIANTRTNLSEIGLSFRDLRWMTPVLHYSYRRWSYTLPPRKGAATNLRWRHKLDREDQFNRVLNRVEVNFDKGKNKSVAFMVYGRPGQGIQEFYDRIEAELPEKLKFELLEIIKPDWPPEFVDNYHLSFSERICRAFDIGDLDEIQAKVEAELCKRSPTSTVMFIRHTPIDLGLDQAMFERHLKRLRVYLDWIDAFLVPAVPPNVRLIIAISFILPECSEFTPLAEALEKDSRLAKLQFLVLKELGPIERPELESFVDDNDIRLPKFSNRDHIEEILNATHGVFEDVLERVKHLREHAWESVS
jgi:hypothetical protein